jgi:hypothetical protein
MSITTSGPTIYSCNTTLPNYVSGTSVTPITTTLPVTASGTTTYSFTYSYAPPMLGQIQIDPATGDVFVFDGTTWHKITQGKVNFWESPEGEEKMRETFPALEKAWNEYQMLLKLYRPDPKSGPDALDDV